MYYRYTLGCIRLQTCYAIIYMLYIWVFMDVWTCLFKSLGKNERSVSVFCFGSFTAYINCLSKMNIKVNNELTWWKTQLKSAQYVNAAQSKCHCTFLKWKDCTGRHSLFSVSFHVAVFLFHDQLFFGLLAKYISIERERERVFLSIESVREYMW